MYREVTRIEVTGVWRRKVHSLPVGRPSQAVWRTFQKTRPINALPLTWVEFFEAFLTRFVPKSLRDRLHDQFIRLEQGPMTVTQYETRFHELSKYATTILPLEEEQIHYFVHG